MSVLCCFAAGSVAVQALSAVVDAQQQQHRAPSALAAAANSAGGKVVQYGTVQVCCIRAVAA
jgi:hypothetical protein